MRSDPRILKIAICDDEKAVCAELEDQLKRIAYRLNLKVETEVWFSGEGLKDYLSEGHRLDVIFLDIELIRMTGIDIGSYIRNVMEDVKTQIVYISSKTNYALQLFKTQPFDFLVKPVTEEQLEDVISRIAKVLLTQNHIFEYQNGRERCQIEYDDILYFKSDLHKVVVVMRQKEVEYYGKLKEIADHLPPRFLVIHKSYIVNMNYVERYTFDFVEMKNHEILTISKAYRKEVRDKLFRRDRTK